MLSFSSYRVCTERDCNKFTSHPFTHTLLSSLYWVFFWYSVETCCAILLVKTTIGREDILLLLCPLGEFVSQAVTVKKKKVCNNVMKLFPAVTTPRQTYISKTHTEDDVEETTKLLDEKVNIIFLCHRSPVTCHNVNTHTHKHKCQCSDTRN